jgi:YVTN family beta-propeller protein
VNSQAMLLRIPLIPGIFSLAFLAGCGGGTGQSLNNQPSPPGGSNPAPTIATVSPNTAAAGGAAFTLTIIGTNFVAASMVNFGGTVLTVTFVNSTQLTAAIPAAAIASTGTPAVTVTNPAPGGGTSNAMNFTITSGTNLVPTINSLSPSCAPAGEEVLNPNVNGQLLVNGLNFVSSSVVRWNGNDRPTTFSSSSQLTAQISASDIAAPGTAGVAVFNPAPGGGSSNTSTFTITTGGVGPQSIAVDQQFAYVANEGCGDSAFGNVSMYTINATAGTLASIGPPVPTNDEGARSVTVDPFGKFAYVANWGEGDTAGSISMYTINTTGALTFTGTINGVCPGLCAPWSVVVDSSGKFAYVANEGSSAPTSVSMFTINTTTGALTSIGMIPAGGRSVSVAVDPMGKFVYVATESDPPGSAGGASMYTMDTGTGALTSMGVIAAGTNPVSVAVDLAGKFAYVANSGSNDVSMYTIKATTGALTSTGTIAAGTKPSSVAVDSSGKFAYVTNSGSNDVSMYKIIDTTTGALMSMGTVAAGLSPSSIAIHPSGKFAYVTNSGSNNISIYKIDSATGALALIGTIGT